MPEPNGGKTLNDVRRFAQQRNFELAIDTLRTVVASGNRTLEALMLGAELAGKVNRPALAIKFCNAATAAFPRNVEPHMRLAEHLVRLALLDEAEASARRAITLLPTLADAHMVLGQVLDVRDEPELAKAALREAARLSPRNIAVLSALATLMTNRGSFDEAAAVLETAISLEPRNGTLWQAKSRLPNSDIDIGQIRRLYTEAENPGQRAAFAFALANCLEREGSYEEAMQYFIEANRLKASPHGDWSAANARRFSELQAAFTREVLADERGLPDAMPIFIVGLPRSGTSLVEQILASHPEVHGAGELTLMGALISEVAASRAQNYADLVKSLTDSDLIGLGRSYVDRLRVLGQGRRLVTDKMPANFVHLGLIRMSLPRAHIIHVRRDPLDNCLSIFKGDFAVGHEYASDLGDLGRYHRQYSKLMSHWEAVLPEPMLTVQYEKLVAAPEAEIRRLLDYCGLEWSDRCLNFSETERAVRTMTSTQIRQPIHNRSVGTAARYGTTIAPLIEALTSA